MNPSVKVRLGLMATLALLLNGGVALAQTYSEDFTGTTTNNSWFSYNGACLTAGTAAAPSSGTAGAVPGCTNIMSSYYNSAIPATGKTADPSLTGGYAGYLGASSAPSSPSGVVADPVGSGALRFTNGKPYGYHENGAIVSGYTFPSSQGLEITFKTVTYLGDSGGSGGDGADGISFYLMDGSKSPGIGAWGGSLAYTCSNSNPPYDGLVGGYVGLGVDEYGNFLNGTTNTLSESGTTASGDNTASGGGYRWNRIGLRGAGSVAWAALTSAYGTNPSSSTLPYYPASLASTCSSGTYNSTLGTCQSCSSGTYISGTNTCNTCSTGTLNSTTGTCSVVNYCSTGTYESNGQYPGMCYICSNGATNLKYTSTTGLYSCKSSGTLTTAATISSIAASTSSPSSSLPQSVYAVQKTCSSGHLWNYSTPSAPSDAGLAALTNTGNTSSILDYTAIPAAYSVLSGVQIANESATTRGSATPIYYDLKITQDGLLSLAYSLSGAAYQTVIKNQPITASNGPLPSTFRFGFAGSTGGSNNIHEILCFKAFPQQESGGSTSVNEKQSAKIQSTTQAYFGFYNPTPTVWTGGLTANTLIDTAGVVTVATAANWDASCVLTGVSSGFGTLTTCTKTGVSTAVTAQSPSSRVMLTWNGTTGVPFEWANLTTTQQTELAFSLGTTDVTTGSDRLNYLRGVRTNEFGNSAGYQGFRQRDGVLSDIVDSSPVWVGPPQAPYTANFLDRLYPTATVPENATANSYQAFVNSSQTRLNVVYVGANDGFLHGFRSGSFDVNGNFVNNSTTPNDGAEVLAFMPGGTLASTASYVATSPTQSQVQNIHGYTPGNPSATPTATVTAVTPNVDFSNTQYGHNFFVDATPGTGDLFYAGSWHTWLVGGLGAGGADIFALDITNPSSGNFTEGNASSIVQGEWTPSTITCSGNSTCGASLGNTFGTPQIRRFHNGTWGAVFGNGLGSTNGDAGIFIMTLSQTSGAPTFYYISAGASGGNGISYVATADLDGDHVTDYVYAGDLKGNIWRFDLTSSNPAAWTVGANPLFTAPAGQPISSDLVVAAVPVTGSGPHIMIAFGTGQRTQLTNTTATTYASGSQDLYGVWDWNMSAWNLISTAQYASLTSAPTNTTGLTSPYVVGKSNLAKQTLTYNSTTLAWDGTNVAICWQGMSLCGATAAANNQFGWYVDLPNSNEQIIYNPTLYQGAFIVDSTVPANNLPTSCSSNLDKGFTYALSVANGGTLPSFFPQYHDTIAAGVETDATGTPYVVKTPENTTAMVYQTVGGTPGSTQANPPANIKANRLTYIELR